MVHILFSDLAEGSQAWFNFFQIWSPKNEVQALSDTPSPGQAMRTPTALAMPQGSPPHLMAVGTPWPQSDQACRRIWKGVGDALLDTSLTLRPNSWRQFLHRSCPPLPSSKPSYAQGLRACVPQATSEKPELLNPEIEECWRGSWDCGLQQRSLEGSSLKPSRRARHSSLGLAFFSVKLD